MTDHDVLSPYGFTLVGEAPSTASAMLGISHDEPWLQEPESPTYQRVLAVAVSAWKPAGDASRAAEVAALATALGPKSVLDSRFCATALPRYDAHGQPMFNIDSAESVLGPNHPLAHIPPDIARRYQHPSESENDDTWALRITMQGWSARLYHPEDQAWYVPITPDHTGAVDAALIRYLWHCDRDAMTDPAVAGRIGADHSAVWSLMAAASMSSKVRDEFWERDLWAGLELFDELRSMMREPADIDVNTAWRVLRQLGESMCDGYDVRGRDPGIWPMVQKNAALGESLTSMRPSGLPDAMADIVPRSLFEDIESAIFDALFEDIIDDDVEEET